MKETLSILAGVIFLLAYIPYIRAILRKETKPAKASWLIWASLDTIALVGLVVKHAVNSQIIAAVCGAWIVVILSLIYGKSGWSWLDKLCLVVAVFGIMLWQLFHDPIFGIVISMIVHVLGSIPTFISAWQDPSREDKLAWTLFWISCVLTVLIIPAWTLVDTIQPFAFLFVESVMVYIVFVRPLMLAKHTHRT